MKLWKVTTSVVSLLGIGFFSATSAHAATIVESYPRLAKAEDAPTNPMVSQVSKKKNAKKVVRRSVKLVNSNYNKH